MSHDIKAQLKSLKHSQVNPSSDWLSSNRALLLSQIKNTVTASAPAPKFNFNNVWSSLSIFLPQTFVLNVVRPVAVLLVVALVGTSGWIATVDASYESLPGDPIYPVKYLSEKVQVKWASVTGDTNTAIKAQSKIVEGKSKDLRKAINDPQKRAAVPAAIENLNREMETLTLATVGNTNAATANEVARSTGEVTKNLNTAQEQLALSTSTADISSSQEIGSVANKAETIMISALQVTVTKIAQGDNSSTIDEVGEMIFGILDNAIKDIVSKEQQVQTINDFVSTILPNALNNNISVSTNTKILVLNATQKMVSSTVVFKSLSEEARQSLSAAIVAYNQGDLSGALDNLRQTTAPKEAAGQMANQTLADVASVGGVVGVPSLDNASLIVTTTASISATGTPGNNLPILNKKDDKSTADDNSTSTTNYFISTPTSTATSTFAAVTTTVPLFKTGIKPAVSSTPSPRADNK